MRVLAVDQYGHIGGGQTVLLQSIGCLVDAGSTVVAAVPAGGSLAAAIDERFGGRVERIDISEPELTTGHKHASDLFRLAVHSRDVFGLRHSLSSFDYVYVNGPRLFPAFLAMSTMASSRFIYHVHLDHSFIEKTVIGALLQHRRTHAVVANSRFILQRLHAALGPIASTRRLRLVENGLDPTLSTLPFVDRWPQRSALSAVIIGHIMPEKGQDIVVDLARSIPDAVFHLLGDAHPSRADFAADLRRRAGSNVVFHSRVSDIASTVAKLGAQLNLVPSRREESFGLSAIEGMACSCLTITSGRGGLAEIAKKTGALVWNSPDESAWAPSLSVLLRKSSEELSSVAERQHAATMLHYSHERFRREITAIFSGERAASDSRG